MGSQVSATRNTMICRLWTPAMRLKLQTAALCAVRLDDGNTHFPLEI